MTTMADGPREEQTDLDESLFKVPAKEYGEHYQNHLLEQYKLYVQMADKISECRQAANNFFLTVNTALIAFLGLVARPDVGSSPDVTVNPPLPWVLVVSTAGVVLCYTWYRLARSYKGLNTGKFEVVQRLSRVDYRRRRTKPSGRLSRRERIPNSTFRSPTSRSGS